MKCGRPRGDLISIEANLQAPSFATVMDGLEVASVREKGGKPVPAKTVQDDHVMYPHFNFFSRVLRELVVLEVYIKDSVLAASLTGGHGAQHVGGQDEVSRQP